MTDMIDQREVLARGRSIRGQSLNWWFNSTQLMTLQPPEDIGREAVIVQSAPSRSSRVRVHSPCAQSVRAVRAAHSRAAHARAAHARAAYARAATPAPPTPRRQISIPESQHEITAFCRPRSHASVPSGKIRGSHD